VVTTVNFAMAGPESGKVLQFVTSQNYVVVCPKHGFSASHDRGCKQAVEFAK
jgi:hypothetical protein